MEFLAANQFCLCLIISLAVPQEILLFIFDLLIEEQSRLLLLEHKYPPPYFRFFSNSSPCGGP